MEKQDYKAPETLQELVNSFKNHTHTALCSKDFSISYPDLHKQILHRCYQLLTLGLKKGDRVILLCRNHPRWLIWNLAINYAGLVDVPRGEYSTHHEVNYIIRHTKARAAVVQDEESRDFIDLKNQSDLEFVIGMKKMDDTLFADSLKIDYDIVIDKVDPDDLASIIYTSGTTGEQKGVMLSHRNFTSNMRMLLERIDFTDNDKVLSILPAWHAFERIIKYCAASKGAGTYYTSKRDFIKDLLQQHPTVMATVPRFWEMIHDSIRKKFSSDTLSGWFGHQMLDAVENDSLKTPVAFFYRLMARMLLFHKIRKNFGKRFRYAVSGGGTLPDYVENFFTKCGIKILEGYGMTEASPVISVRRPDRAAPHTVGPVLENLELKIVDPESGRTLSPGQPGIIHLKGPSITSGYYRDNDYTQRCFVDGFLNTGDIGFLDKKNNLVLCGRQKDIIVLSNAENVQPAGLERRLRESEYIAIPVVIGQGWKALGALIVPDFQMLKQFCDTHNINHDNDDFSEAVKHADVIELYKKEIDRLVNNSGNFKTFERIQAFEVLNTAFRQGKELTATAKLKRHVINQKYASHCENLSKRINKR